MYQNKTKNDREVITKLLTQREALGVSDRYKIINTGQVLNKLIKSGFEPIDIDIAGVRPNSNKNGYQAHKIILENKELTELMPEGNKFQLLLYNSYDKSAPLTLQLGVFRFACDNGLVVGDAYGCFKMKHIGDVESQLDTFIHDLPHKIAKLIDQINKFKSITLNPIQERKFILDTLYNTVLKDNQTIIENNQLFKEFNVPKRDADLGRNLYVVLNRLQEHILRGGVPTQQIGFNDKGQPNRIMLKHTRPIANILKNKAFNEIIWSEASKLVSQTETILRAV